ncbi:hypothetical protein F4779DRAFT_635930 [Xylariaceae sp. FL0662B]|nr:hypothetical protein F4779DRAFT_635930 [Xylariaceae sp. FL0662B]
MASIVPDTDIMPVGSYPKTGIDVLIVGAGLAGLSAAIESVRKGHNVRILERASDINTSGDMFFIGHSAVKFFRHWPEMAREYDRVSLRDAFMETRKHSGEVTIPPSRASDFMRVPGMDPKSPPGSFQLRPAIYKLFVNQLERLGVKVLFSKRVVDYYEDEVRGKATAVTDQGEEFEADVVIAADGIGSKTQKLVGGSVRAVPSGREMWRAIVPWSLLEDSPEISEAFKLAPTKETNGTIARPWLGPGIYAMTLRLPDSVIWLINHEATGSSTENWQNFIDPSEVLANMDNGTGGVPWSPAFKELVRRTPRDTIVNFALKLRDPQPSWASPGGRVVNIGDAAHAFLPTSGNGATQAIEDAVSLVTCLQIGGKDNIPQSVRAHVRFRFVRTACIQKLGVANGKNFMRTNWNKVKINPKHIQPRLPAWIWTHDPEAYAYEYYDKMVQTMKDGVPLTEIDQNVIPPNYPRGHKYEPWSIANLMADIKNGKDVDLGLGDWQLAPGAHA